MTRIAWDGDRAIALGLDRGMFYPKSGPGVPWNGLSSVKEAPGEVSTKVRYLDGVKVSNRQSREEFSGTIEAFTYPTTFYETALIQARQTPFNLSYRCTIGEIEEIHLVYNVSISGTGVNHQQRETDKFSWPFTTKPVAIPLARPAAHLIIVSPEAYPWTVFDLENILYGSDSAPPRMPSPQEVWDIVEANSIVLVTDNGDGTFSVTGPDDVVFLTSSTTFEISWPSVVNIDVNTYRVSSL